MPSTSVMNGSLMGVYIGSTLIAHSTEGSISLSMDTRDISSKDSAGARALLEGMKSGSISVSALYTEDSAYGADELYTAMAARTPLAVKFSTEVSGDHFWSASSYLTSLEVSASTEDNMTFSATFELTGAITYTAVS